MADDATAAGAVHDVDRFAEVSLDQAGHDASDRIGAAPAAHGTIKVSGRVGYSVAREQPLAISTATISQEDRTTDSDLFID